MRGCPILELFFPQLNTVKLTWAKVFLFDTEHPVFYLLTLDWYLHLLSSIPIYVPLVPLLNKVTQTSFLKGLESLIILLVLGHLRLSLTLSLNPAILRDVLGIPWVRRTPCLCCVVAAAPWWTVRVSLPLRTLGPRQSGRGAAFQFKKTMQCQFLAAFSLGHWGL